MDEGAWWTTVCGVAKNRAGLSNSHTHTHTYTYIPILVAQLVKNPPAMWEVRSLGWEDPLEKGKATHSSILAWRILWTV